MSRFVDVGPFALLLANNRKQILVFDEDIELEDLQKDEDKNLRESTNGL